MGAAAYQSGTKMQNRWDGEVHDYRKKEGVIFTDILLPANAPAFFSDRNTLWNSVEMSESRGDAQLARSFEVSFPKELSLEENKKLILDYLKQFVDVGMCVDYAIHDPDPPGHNPHCHFLLTMRPLDEKGQWLPKSKLVYDLDEDGNRIRLDSGKWKTHKENLVDWNDHDRILQWRESWATVVNHYLEKNGFEERIDHRSNEARGIEEIPTIHMGTAAWALEKKGIRTERGDINRLIKSTNRMIRELKGQIHGLTDWIATIKNAMREMMKAPQSPSLSELISRYMDMEYERLQKYSPIFAVKQESKQFNELRGILKKLNQQGIYTLEEFETALENLRSRSFDTQRKVVTAEKRMKELEQLISMATAYQTHLPVRKGLDGIRWERQKAKYRKDHEGELSEWQKSSRFLHGKGIDIPHLKDSIADWKSEMAELRKSHDEDCALLKAQRNQLKELDQLHRKVEKTVTQAEKERQKKQDLEI